MGNQTLLHYLYTSSLSLLCHVLKAACHGHIFGAQTPWEEGCLPGRLWELGQEEGEAPALGDKAPAFPQLLWRAAQLYHPCCGSQALSVGSENPCSIPREKCCPCTLLESNCLHPAWRVFGRSHIHTKQLWNWGRGARQVVQGFPVQEKEEVMVRAHDRESGHPE